MSKKPPGFKELLPCEDPEVFLLSCWLVENCTNKGEDGWEGRLGEELLVPKLEGEPGLWPLLMDKARFTGMGIMGLPSREGAGEPTAGLLAAEMACE